MKNPELKSKIRMAAICGKNSIENGGKSRKTNGKIFKLTL